ncbi:Uncharacterized protein dnm_032980 [Desulfonema magnum]|uniref:Uncharacterized protein n=1 Tax=Desulfonema magnum TaxID=45655 RepID=A0A975GNV7_9BACT|nr:Uncharacterized protein dnm_032980 [Desulfonema magnum]
MTGYSKISLIYLFHPLIRHDNGFRDRPDISVSSPYPMSYSQASPKSVIIRNMCYKDCFQKA